LAHLIKSKQVPGKLLLAFQKEFYPIFTINSDDYNELFNVKQYIPL
jgi:hypothetical protein